MVYELGCDVAKLKIDVSLVNGAGIEQWRDIVPNNVVSLAQLLLSVSGHYVGDEIECVVEATGQYHYPLTEAAGLADIPCRVYNPILTSQAIKQSIRGKKTDRTDALAIARIGLRKEGRLYVAEPYMDVKHLSRGQQKLGEISTSFKLYESHLKAALGEELSSDAKKLMSGIETQIKAARQQFVLDTLSKAPSDLVRRLRSIPGVGPYIAANLIGEIQDVSRFSSYKKLISYAGLDPKIRKSGSSVNHVGRLTKRGSAHLRRSVFIAASVARQRDPYFKALYDKKRAEGKPYTVAIIVVARRLLVIVRAVWLSNQDYNPNLLT
ncbi:MAG TPA: IS110 family transposase [Candidatus Saccharimonadales bacterium]|nr:IS110 family transposase [Candidatus Saccharimonadales bacterium]